MGPVNHPHKDYNHGHDPNQAIQFFEARYHIQIDIFSNVIDN